MKFIYIVAIALIVSLNACAVNLGQDSRYGNYGGPPREKQAEPPFSIDSTYRDVRWFPTHVRFAPDDSHLLVSLCHTMRPTLCRIGKYHIATKEWEILPYEDRRTYRWPVYHPGGKEIAVSTAPCDDQYRCGMDDHVLARMPADGSSFEPVGDVIAWAMSFSPDGKRLIYWRVGPVPNLPQRRASSGHVYEIDWITGKERQLTKIALWSTPSPPRYVQGGKAFLFPVDSVGHVVPSGPYIAEIRDKPARTESDMKLWDLLGLAVTSDDKILYSDQLTPKKEAHNPVALALRPAKAKWGDGSSIPKEVVGEEARNRWFGTGPAMFLRNLTPGSPDEVGFDVPSIPFDAAITSDAKFVAFILGGTASYFSGGEKLGLIGQGGTAQPTYIDWPKLDLKPGRHPTTKP